MRIVTITLNPAFDVHCRLSRFFEGHEHFAEERRCDAGGKGINIARACHANGIDCTALVLLGRENGAEFEEALVREGISYRALYSEGRIRENLTLHAENIPETRISFDGFSADASCLSRFEEMLGEKLDDTYLCLAGSLSKGIEKKDVKDFLLRLCAKGAKIVLDSRSFSREDILEIRPFLIKPNLEELISYEGRPIETQEEIARCALRFCRTGVNFVLVSMGAEGALLVTDGRCLRAKVPKIKALSSVGAGDSMIAGYLIGLSRGNDVESCFQLSLSFGSAACMRKGTQPPLPEDVAAIKEGIRIFSLA